MNPLTLVKRIQQINSKEAALGISEQASWHAKYKESAYVFVGGIPYDLTEGDLLAVFAQCGEVVDVNLVRDKGTGKSKGFAFVAYEDQRSTNLAVDNLNGAQILGRIIRVDHVSNYKKKEEEDEEQEQQKREARGVCYAFQRGECNRGAGCKFSHDEERNRNTGWGPKDSSSKWGNDKYEGPSKSGKRSGLDDRDAGSFKEKGDEEDTRSQRKRIEKNPSDEDGGDHVRLSGRNEKDLKHKEEWDRQVPDERSARHEPESHSREDRDRRRGREENRLERGEHKSYRGKDYDKRGGREVDGSDHVRLSGRNEKDLNHKEEWDRRVAEERSARHEPESHRREDRDKRGREENRLATDEPESYRRKDYDKRGGREETEPNPIKDRDRNGREEKRSGRHESGLHSKEDRDQRRGEKQSAYDEDYSSHRRREADEVGHRST